MSTRLLTLTRNPAMHTCTCIYICIASISIRIYMDIFHTHSRTRTHTHTLSLSLTITQIYLQSTSIRNHIHTCIHTQTRARTHAQAYMHTHTHPHTHAQAYMQTQTSAADKATNRRCCSATSAAGELAVDFWLLCMLRVISPSSVAVSCLSAGAYV